MLLWGQRAASEQSWRFGDVSSLPGAQANLRFLLLGHQQAHMETHCWGFLPTGQPLPLFVPLNPTRLRCVR